MEALWNYFYWQALSTNALDDIGHVLRLNIVTATACTNYITDKGEDDKDTGDLECNQFLGPTQPGVFTPDPTDTTSRSSAKANAQPAAAPAPARVPEDAGLLNYLLAP